MCTFAALIIACSRPSFAVKKTSHSHIISTSKCVNGRREENSRQVLTYFKLTYTYSGWKKQAVK